MLLKLVIKNISEWKAILNAISDLTEEATFLCNADGITFRGIDKAHVAYLSVTFPKSSFEIYDYETSFFVLLVEEFKNLINSADNNAIVNLQIENEDNIIIFIKSEFNVEFKLKLLVKELGQLIIPRIDAKTQVEIEPNTLIKIMDDVQKISKYVTINSTSNKIQFLGKGDVGSAKIELQLNSELIKLNTITDSTTTYSLEYLEKILQSVGKTCKNLSFEYGTGTPIHITFGLQSNTIVEYYLAPRI